MTRQWIPYGLLLVVSVIAGIVIGGGPGALRSDGSPPASPSIETPITDPPTSSTAAFESVPADTVASTDASADDSATTEPSNTAVAPTTSAATPTIPVAPTTTTTTTTTTTAQTTTTTLVVELRSRDDLDVAVANAVGTVGAAGVAADALAELGYETPATRDSALFEITTVFFRDGLDAEAERLAVDAGLAPESIASIIDLPDLIGSDAGPFELILVLGTDGAGPRAGST